MLLFEDCRYVVITNTLGRINRFKSYWWNGLKILTDIVEEMSDVILKDLSLNNTTNLI